MHVPPYSSVDRMSMLPRQQCGFRLAPNAPAPATHVKPSETRRRSGASWTSCGLSPTRERSRPSPGLRHDLCIYSAAFFIQHKRHGPCLHAIFLSVAPPQGVLRRLLCRRSCAGLLSGVFPFPGALSVTVSNLLRLLCNCRKIKTLVYHFRGVSGKIIFRCQRAVGGIPGSRQHPTAFHNIYSLSYTEHLNAYAGVTLTMTPPHPPPPVAARFILCFCLHCSGPLPAASGLGFPGSRRGQTQRRRWRKRRQRQLRLQPHGPPPTPRSPLPEDPLACRAERFVACARRWRVGGARTCRCLPLWVQPARVLLHQRWNRRGRVCSETC